MREVGGYRLIRQIGFGGMSTVYEAVNGGGDHVALKLLHPSLAADEQSRARLSREVAVLRRVRSPYVAEVIDAELDAVEPFIVTELVDGLTLDKDVEINGIYTDDDLVALGEKLAQALSSVHELGVLHRDLKPSNVMIADSHPILIDFGIAQEANATRLTQQGSLALTPGYCDPRVLYGAPPDAAADWWALAAVLAFAATGEPPFGTGSAPVIMRRVLNAEVNVADVEPSIAQAFSQALARDLDYRLSYEDLLEVLKAPDSVGALDSAHGVAGEGSHLTRESTRILVPSEVSSTQLYGSTQLYRAEYDEEHSGNQYGEAALELEPERYADRMQTAQPEHIPHWARRPQKIRVIVFLAWLALAAFGAVWPIVACAIAAGAVLLFHVVGTSFGIVYERRIRRGFPKGGDAAVAFVRLPLTALLAFVRVVVAAAVIGVVLYCGLWIAAVLSPESIDMARLEAQSVGVAAGGGPASWAVNACALFTALLWFAPGGAPAREGARYVCVGRGGSSLRRFVWILVAVTALGLGLYAALAPGVTPVSWDPLGNVFNFLA